MSSAANPGGSRLPGSGRPQFGQGSASALSMKWSALHDAAAVISTLAETEAETLTGDIRSFPERIRDTAGWRKELAERGIEDLTAIMEPGLSALLATLARGSNPQAPAKALLQEFVAARDALLALAVPENGGNPLRFA